MFSFTDPAGREWNFEVFWNGLAYLFQDIPVAFAEVLQFARNNPVAMILISSSLVFVSGLFCVSLIRTLAGKGVK